MNIRKILLSIMIMALLATSGCGSSANLIETKNTGDIREGYIITIGGKIWFSIKGADKKGVPLLVVHGGPGASHDYLETIDALSNERPVIFYDQLGCGNSDKVENKSLWSISSYVDELSVVRKTLNLKKVHILGQSWGTMLIVDYMLQEKEPKGVISLTLSGPVLNVSRFMMDQKKYLDTEFTQAARDVIANAEKTGDYKSKEYQDVVAIYYKMHLCRLKDWPDPLKRTMSKMNNEIYNYMWGPSEFTINGILKNYDRTGDLGRIKIPVLFTCGRFDESVPSTTAIYRNAIPGAEISIFEGASHEHHLENIDEYNETLRGFLHRAEIMKGIKQVAR
jgi:proline-specific peptidase